MVGLDRELADVVGAMLGSAVVAASRVHGGDVAIAFAVDLADGRRVFVKTHLRPPPEFFTTEASGLEWLGEAWAVDVPRVLAVSDAAPAFLALEWVERGPAGPSTEPDLGRQLAELHRAGAPASDARTGALREAAHSPTSRRRHGSSSTPSNRLLPLAKLAADAGALSTASIERLEALAGRLEAVGGPPEPPARLHGDLWGGNRLVGLGGTSWLIDPAAHGGHREFDLAMMRLFGGFGEDCFAAYAEAFPLADGWEDRIALHQIAPLVVHAIKFGGGYVPAATAAIDRYR